MIDIDLTMPIQIANILILIVIMNAVLYRPIRSILTERKKKLAGLDKEVVTFNNNAKLRLEEFEQKINDARSRAKAELDAGRSVAQTSGAETLSRVRKEVDASKAEQLAQLHAEYTSVQKELKGQVESFAAEMAGKVLGRAV